MRPVALVTLCGQRQVKLLRQRQLLEEFERESNRETSPHSSGFFARMKEFFEGKGS